LIESNIITIIVNRFILLKSLKIFFLLISDFKKATAENNITKIEKIKIIFRKLKSIIPKKIIPADMNIKKIIQKNVNIVIDLIFIISVSTGRPASL
jgi:hypothetical protein